MGDCRTDYIFAALPHKEVDTADFYKHIADGLPEPRRMRQLLTWCATRALGDKPTGARPEDASVRLAGIYFRFSFTKVRLTCCSSSNTRRTAQRLFNEFGALELVWAGGCESSCSCGEETEPEKRPKRGQDQGARGANTKVC